MTKEKVTITADNLEELSRYFYTLGYLNGTHDAEFELIEFCRNTKNEKYSNLHYDLWKENQQFPSIDTSEFFEITEDGSAIPLFERAPFTHPSFIQNLDVHGEKVEYGDHLKAIMSWLRKDEFTYLNYKKPIDDYFDSLVQPK